MSPEEQIIRLKAIVNSTRQQRDDLANLCTGYAADIAVAREVIKQRDEKIKELDEVIKKLTAEQGSPSESDTTEMVGTKIR